MDWTVNPEFPRGNEKEGNGKKIPCRPKWPHASPLAIKPATRVVSQAKTSMADTGIPSASSRQRSFLPQTFCQWLARKETRQHAAGTSIAPASGYKLTNLHDLQIALKSHVHLGLQGLLGPMCIQKTSCFLQI
eukprot:scaffold207557_cov19-Tisochrysis_lutea.AAC.1